MLRRLAGFEIIAEVGRGAMATVYHARPIEPKDSMPDEVAIKVLRPQYLTDLGFRARFEREGQMITALQHPAIIPVYAFGQQGDQLYIAMAYMPHGSLAERLLHRQLPVAEALTILSRVGVALDYAHRQGVIHRDLKPSNVLFSAREDAFLADFGIAHALERGKSGTETISGTPAYMSPEQARGEQSIGPASDIYALGVLAFQMLTGRLPFAAETAVAVLLQHMEEPPPRPSQTNPSLPPGVDAVLAKALAKDAARRYGSATAFVAALRRALEGRIGAVEPWPGPATAEASETDDAQHEESLPVSEQPDTDDRTRDWRAARVWLGAVPARLRTAFVRARRALVRRPVMAFSLVTILAIIFACLAVGALRGGAMVDVEDHTPVGALSGVVPEPTESIYLPLTSFSEASPDSSATTAAVPTPAVNVNLLVDGDSVTLLNISDGPLALGSLTLRRVNGDGETVGTFELRGLRRVAGRALDALPAGDCLQVWHFDALAGRGPEKPGACDTLRGWLATRDTAPLFQGVQEGDAFEVLRGEQRLVSCVLIEGNCAFLVTQE